MKKVTVKNNNYYNGDCIAGCREHIKDESIDLIITDPPYGINGEGLHKHYNRNEKYVIEGYIDVPAAEYQEFSLNWIKEAARILRPGGQIYIVSGYTHLYEILNALRQTNLKEINHIVWKYNFGVYTRKKFITSHYHILLYAKPPLKGMTFNQSSRYGIDEKDSDNRSLNYSDREDVWIINREYKPGKLKNKNELPYQLLIKMIQYSSNEEDLVCDPFMGGFTTAKACVGLNRRFVGFELSESAFAHQVKEMENFSPSYLVDKIREPIKDTYTNRGKSWTAGQKKAVREDFEELLSGGMNKGAAIRNLCDKYGRGRWSIERVLSPR